MKPTLVLSLDEQGKAEFLRHGKTVWSSDADPDVLEEFGKDFFDDSDGDELVFYLVDIGIISDDDVPRVEIESPEPLDGDPDDDDDDNDDDDDDDDYVEEEFIRERRR